MAKFGLIGKNLGHSFSKTFFTYKFEKENRKDSYHNFELDNLEEFKKLISKHPDIRGLNVTIPFKEAIIPYLDRLDKEAMQIGAVNTIKFRKDGKLIGYNSDHYGFAQALANFFPLKEKTALVLGTGGASKAIQYVLETMGFDFSVVSRKTGNQNISYEQLNQKTISEHFLIVNCTPLGTIPNTEQCPKIPYQHLGADHVLFDLVYNPRETEFMKRGFVKGARVTNGLKMLEYQAKRSWNIWKS